MRDAEPYMNGIGTMEKTHELIDAVWDTLGYALLGCVPLTAATLFPVIAIIHGWPKFTLLAVAPLVFLAWLFSRPWLAATRDIREHTRRMSEETKRRGKGWARS